MKRLFALVLLLAAPAHAETPFRLYADGKYEESMSAALAQNDAAGFSAAARAVLAEEVSGDQPCLDCLQKAEKFARRAISADPKMADGRVYLALALGLESQIEGGIVARLRGYPGKAKHALDAALANNPNNSWALAALGGWNFAIVHGGGASLADLFYGATLKKGLDDFDASFKSAPDNIVVRYQYALSLSSFDALRFHGEIEDALTRVAGGAAPTAYERLLRKRAGELLDLLKKGDRDAYAARVRKYEGYP